MMALRSAKIAPSVSESTPGFATMSTPKNPANRAAHRTRPARSLSQTTDRRPAHRGAEKLMAMAPASGIRANAITEHDSEIDCDSTGRTWSRGRLVENTESPLVGRTNAAQTIKETKERLNITSPIG